MRTQTSSMRIVRTELGDKAPKSSLENHIHESAQNKRYKVSAACLPHAINNSLTQREFRIKRQILKLRTCRDLKDLSFFFNSIAH